MWDNITFSLPPMEPGLRSGGSSPDAATYILAGIVCGIAVDVVLVLAEKSYQAVKYFLTHKENT